MTARAVIIAFAAASAILAPAAGALAQASPDPAAVRAGAYKLESSHARVVWRVNHMGLSEWFGDFSHATGAAHLDPHDPAANSVEISIPAGSVSTTNGVLDGELKSSAWFDAAAFPAITFKSTAVKIDGPGKAEVLGDLTLHGVTRPVALRVTFHGAGLNALSRRYTVGFDATTSIKRSDFGVKAYLPAIGDDVDIEISAPFEKQD